MYECPWCNKAGFSFWQKQTLGPSRLLACPHCKKQVSVCWNRAQLAAIPVLAFGFLGMLAGKEMHGTWSAVLFFAWVGISLGMAFTAPLYHFYVPLVRKTT